MTLENVSVVDQNGRLLSADIGSDQSGRVNAKYLHYQKQLERQVSQHASDMLIPIVGQANFRVQVSADLDFSKTEETQEFVDKDPIVQSEHRIESTSVDRIAVGVPGSLSNRPPSRQKKRNTNNSDSDNKNTNAKTEINRQYAVGNRVRHTHFQQGRINRLAVSILLNNAVAPAETGWTDEEKQQIDAMIRDAVGLSTERGDQLSVMSFNFTPVKAVTPDVLPWWKDPTLEQPIRYVIGGLLGFALIVFVLRPLVLHLTGLSRESNELLPVSIEQNGDDYDDNLQTRAEIAHETELNQRLSSNGIDTEHSGFESGSDLLPPPGSPLEIQLKHLQLIATEEPTRVAEVLKQWINTNEQRTES